MKCTNCNRQVRPVVSIDIDGTLGNFHGHFQNFMMKYLMYKGLQPVYEGGESYKEWGKRAFRIDDRTWHDIKLAYRQGAQKRSMPIYAHAAALCESVQMSGAELWLSTTRPYLRLDNVDPDTRFWLDRNKIPYDGLLYDEDKYVRLLEIVGPNRVIAVVDDLVEECVRANEVFGDVAIWRRNDYNTYDSNGAVSIGFHNLVALSQHIHELIGDWKYANAQS